MGINSNRHIIADLQVGPTENGMVRIFIDAQGTEIPIDFEPKEAKEIADELYAAAKAALQFSKD